VTRIETPVGSKKRWCLWPLAHSHSEGGVLYRPESETALDFPA
jgi:hypothetical protein